MNKMKWRKTALKNLCSRIGDGLHGTPSYSDSDIYFINGNNLEHGQIVITDNTKTVSQDELEKNFIHLDDNSLLMSINGTLGEMAFYQDERVMLGKSAAYLNFKSSINRFYFYYFQLSEVQKYFWNVATGSTIKNLSLKSLQEFEVPVPEEFEWKGIVYVLSSLDSKIELNNRINAELEAMAKTIYDYWFVQFDFPISKELATQMGQPELEGRPYKSSGGKMVYNEELKREVPEGWRVGQLGDFGKISMCKRVMKHETSEMKEIPFYKISTFGDEANTFISKSLYDSYRDKYSYPKRGDILISAAGTIGKTVVFDGKPSYFQDSNIVWLAHDESVISNSYLNCFYQTKPWVATGGSTIKRLYNDNISSLKIVIPKLDIIEKFSAIFNPHMDKQHLIAKENQELASLRDWLLPMLMNGQVKVGEVKPSRSLYGADKENDGLVGRMAAERESKYEVKG